jgi:GNAT superfamily N-acetyltransferase
MSAAPGNRAHAPVTIRQAREADVPAIMAMFATDTEGGHGDTDDPAALPDYLAAYRRIEASPNDTLYVAEIAGLVVGTFQTTLVTSMTARGSSNLIVEAVHTRADMRGRGIGEVMMRHAIADAKARGARLVQLSSNRARAGAHRFYERLGFAPTHLGFKLRLKA